MEWILIFFFIVFLIINFTMKEPYKKFYDSGVITFLGIYGPEFNNYLGKIESEARKRGELNLLRERGYQRDQLDRSDYWQKALRSHREQFVRRLSNWFFGAYILALLILMWTVLYYNFYIGNINEALKFSAPFSIVPVLFWLKRRSHYDGLLQGYLNGYMDALERVYGRKDDSGITAGGG